MPVVETGRLRDWETARRGEELTFFCLIKNVRFKSDEEAIASWAMFLYVQAKQELNLSELANKD